MTPSRLFGACALIAATLLPAAPAAPVPKHLMPKEDPPWYPTKVGDRRVFVENKKLSVSVVTKVEKGADGTTVWMNMESEDGTHQPDSVVRFSEKGVEVLEFVG